MAAIDQVAFLSTYFDSTTITGSLEEFVIDAGLLVVLSVLLSFLYQKFGNALSNRKKFSANFILLSLITMMIISVIRSSLALSLGLVGALSIIRFRSAIKEPEELAYIFLAVSLGLAFGAGQREVAIVFFGLISVVIVARAMLTKKLAFLQPKTDDVLYVSMKSSKAIDLKKVHAVLDAECHFIDLKRVDAGTTTGSEVLFLVKTKTLDNVVSLQNKLHELDAKAAITILNDEGLFTI
jgi:uncharacterized membrane protein YhiD involved in acid resistance